MSDSEVLIVGGGPVGLVLACELARRGIDVRVIDRAVEHPVGTRARGVRARTQEIFEDLGVLDDVIQHAERPMPSRFYDATNQVVREALLYDAPPVPGAPYPGSLVVSQHFTEDALRRRLESSGGRVELDTELVGITQDRDAVVASIQIDGRRQQIRARYVIGCDGGSSAVRRQAGISFLGETWEQQRMLFGNLHVDGLDSSVAHMWAVEPAGMLTLCPMPNSGTWFFTAPLPPDVGQDSQDWSVEALADIFEQRVGMAGVTFSDPLYLSVYQVNIRMVDRYREGRVLLAGDAAHVHTPAGGQGMNTGIQDAYNLGWKLAHVLRGAPASLLDTYEEERLPIAEHVLASTTARGRSWASSDTSRVAERMAGAFKGQDPFSDTSQLAITYRGSSLAFESSVPLGIAAGDRAPDARCVDPCTGESVRLFDLLRGTHVTVLVFGDRPELAIDELHRDRVRVYRIHAPSVRAPSRSALIDVSGEAHELYGAHAGGLVVIRPDGYIAYAAGDSDDRPVAAHLAALLPSS